MQRPRNRSGKKFVHSVNAPRAITPPKPMRQTSDVRTKTTLRGSRSPVPQWWLKVAERRFRQEQPTLTLSTLGAKLAEAVQRPKPWRHPSVLRFFDGQPTAEMADAFLRLFPELPRYVYFPEDEIEANAFEAIRVFADARRQKRPTLQPLLRAVDRRTVDRAGVVAAPGAVADAVLPSPDGSKETPGGVGRGHVRDIPGGARRMAAARSRPRSRRS